MTEVTLLTKPRKDVASICPQKVLTVGVLSSWMWKHDSFGDAKRGCWKLTFKMMSSAIPIVPSDCRADAEESGVLPHRVLSELVTHWQSSCDVAVFFLDY